MVDKIINNVNEILNIKNKNSNADISEIEGEIDKIVYELYDLSEEEIKIIEGKWLFNLLLCLYIAIKFDKCFICSIILFI